MLQLTVVENLTRFTLSLIFFQVWALNSLALIADTGGPLFRSYVEASLQLVMKSLTVVPLYCVELRQATGKMMAALITGMGPELQGTEI